MADINNQVGESDDDNSNSEALRRVGLKVNLERLETRLNCVELAEGLDTGERGLYTIQGSTWTNGYKGK